MSIQSTAPLSAYYALIRDPMYAMQTVPPWCAWKVQYPQHGRPLPRMFLPTQHLCKMPGEISTDRIHKDTMPMFNTYLASCFLLSAVTKYTNCMDGTLTMVVWSRDNCVPPKNTGNACASHVAGLNMTGNVKFTWPDRIYCVWAEKKIACKLSKRISKHQKHAAPNCHDHEHCKQMQLYTTYLIHDIVQVQYVIVEAFVFPAGADIVIRVWFAIVVCRRILYHIVQQAQFLEYLASNHVLIAIFRCHNDTSEAS